MNQLAVQIQELQDKVNSLNEAALGHPTFPVILKLFRIFEECFPLNRHHLVLDKVMQEVFLITRRSFAKVKELENNIQNFAMFIHTKTCQEVFNLESSLTSIKLIRQIVWLNGQGIKSRKCISINSLSFNNTVLTDERQN